MRSFVRVRARLARHGLGAVLLAVSTLTTACDWITGVPTVTRVELGLAPTTLSVGASGQANGVAIGKNDAPITSSKVKVAYSTSNPSVATVNQTTGVIVAVAVGTTEITATARGKSAKATLEVTSPRAVRVTPVENPLNVPIGQPAQLHLQMTDLQGNPVTNRPITIQSGAPLIASVTATSTNNITVTGLSLGSTLLTGTVDGVVFTAPVTVTPVPAKSLEITLQKGGTKLLVGESTQLVWTFKDASGNVLSPVGRALSFVLSDQTVATISPAGIITGQKQGTTTITVTEQGTGLQAKLDLTVDVVPAKDLVYTINPIFRKGAPRGAAALVLDSAGNQINRAVAYTSSNPSVIQINPTSGLATPASVGTATLTAKVDNLTRSVDVRVTLLPITKVIVLPVTQTVYVGQTVQYTAQLTDSLNNLVTDRTPNWFSSATNVATVSSTGFVTATGPGTATINALIEMVPGEAANIGGQSQIVVNATPVDSIYVSTAQVAVARQGQVAVTMIARDAAGNQLFGRTIVATSANAGIAAVANNNNQTLVIQGVATGATTITLQAVNSQGIPEGKPTVINVTVP